MFTRVLWLDLRYFFIEDSCIRVIMLPSNNSPVICITPNICVGSRDKEF